MEKIIKIALFAGLLIIGRRVFHEAKRLMKNSGQNPLDFDKKKIEAIKP
jgi:hypothetical protein